MNIFAILGWIQQNQETIYTVATTIVTIASAASRALPQGSANDFFQKVIKFVNFLAINKPITPNKPQE